MTLLLKASCDLSLQWVIVVTSKITTDHHKNINNEKVRNIARITKIWHRNTKWANAVIGKMGSMTC